MWHRICVAIQAFPSSITETLVYDAAKRPVSISLGSAGSLSQTYGRAGRVTSDSRSLSGITGDAGGGTQSFSYDGLGRLTGSTGLTSGARSYTYDLDANRLTRLEATVTTTFSYDRTDEVVNQVIGGTTKTFASDPFGNQTTAADANSLLTSYAYDEASRLTTITPPSGSPASFSFDALDRPKTRTVGAAVDTYGYLGASKTSYETGAGSTDALLDASGARLAVKTGGVVSFALFDLHGSLVGLCTAGTTTLSNAYRYDAFGQTLVATGSAVNPWRYRGLLDVSPSATPLYALGARFYSPMLGTFTSEDSVAGKAADPLSMNRYLYAEADPTTLVDPDGHAVFNQAICSPLADFCRTSSGGYTINADRAPRGSPTTKPPTTTTKTVHFVSGVPVSQDGLLVRHDDFDKLADNCQLSGPPPPEFGDSACGAWWKTFAANNAQSGKGGSPDSLFWSGTALGALDETLEAIAKKAPNIHGFYVISGSITLTLDTTAIGLRVTHAGVLDLRVGGLLGTGAKWAGSASGALEFIDAYNQRSDKDTALHVDPMVGYLRADLQATVQTGVGVWAGVYVFGACEGASGGFGLPVCALLGIGAATAADAAAGGAVDTIYDVIDSGHR